MNNLKEYRLRANLNQLQLAEKLRVSQSCISRWEHGRTYPEVTTAKRISKYLNMPFDLIFGASFKGGPFSLPVYESIQSDGQKIICTREGCILQVTEEEMRILLTRLEQLEVISPSEKDTPLDPEMFFGYYCTTNNLIPLVTPNSVNIVFQTTKVCPGCIYLISTDEFGCTPARLVEDGSGLIAILNHSMSQYQKYSVSDMREGTIRIHGIIVQSRVPQIHPKSDKI
ncbi:MAG: helix-turn-helix transcriptional regulator [Clostridiales bacterium]|nr:helix-turn-helix transcriptional regulator [Clostridiales bacterium]